MVKRAVVLGLVGWMTAGCGGGWQQSEGTQASTGGAPGNDNEGGVTATSSGGSPGSVSTGGDPGQSGGGGTTATTGGGGSSGSISTGGDPGQSSGGGVTVMTGGGGTGHEGDFCTPYQHPIGGAIFLWEEGCCLPPPDPADDCEHSSSWRHEGTSGLCLPGCGVYSSLDQCESVCDNSTTFGACEEDADCVVESTRCCACEPIDTSDLVAVHRETASSFRQALGCSEDCVCEDAPELERVRKYYRARCVDYRCALEDIRQTELTECFDEGDCAIHDGAGCCEDCDGENLTAINPKSQAYADLCSAEVCAACEPPAVPYEAACVDWRCQVVPVP